MLNWIEYHKVKQADAYQLREPVIDMHNYNKHVSKTSLQQFGENM